MQFTTCCGTPVPTLRCAALHCATATTDTRTLAPARTRSHALLQLPWEEVSVCTGRLQKLCGCLAEVVIVTAVRDFTGWNSPALHPGASLAL